MSIHYLLDGYNIIHQMPVSKLDKLEDQRRGLIRFIEEKSPQGSRKNPVTVVFDGSLDAFGGMPSASCKVLFSKGEKADDTIRSIVSQSKNTKSITVVTDDRGIQYAVRALGAKVLSVKEFLSEGKSNKTQAGPDKRISKADEAEINSEMSKIWLKSDKPEQ